MNEIEIKFRVGSMAGVTRKLRESGFRLITRRTHEMNTLYDFRDRRLRKRGELLRLRKYGSSWVLTHKAKGRSGRHKTRIETETPVADGAKMGGILRHLGCEPVFRYEKFRSEWSDGKGHVVLDVTPIGNFGEIEGRSRWIDQTARLLGIDVEDYITQTYSELFTAWNRRRARKATEMTFKAIRSSSAS
ncbi:MAG: class IV adenylate cyclase [Acidobacteriales bacterium]|nr:class IV adenylate cyclase [Terriglobales bacterium]